MSIQRSSLFLIALALAFLLPAGNSSAVPANPDTPITLEQPDGATFPGRLIGDEWSHYYETEAGLTVIRDPGGTWTYAERDTDGGLRASDLVVGIDSPQGPPHLRPDDAWLAAGRAHWEGPPPTVASITGTQQLVIILIEFSDTAVEGSAGPHDADYFENATTGLVLGSNQGKLHGYLDEVSYGLLDLQGVVAGGAWHVSAQTEAYYGADCDPGQSCEADYGPASGADNCSVCIYELAREAVQAADAAGFDFAPYDTDSDGWVDHVMIVHAGENQASSGGAPGDIWSHTWTIPGGGELVDGKLVERYTMVSEWDAMSVFAHEFSHDLGAPDLYDYDLDSEPVGRWCNMGYNYESERPPHLCGLLKVDIDADFGNGMTGWITPDLLGADSSYTALRLDENQTGSVLMTDPAFSSAEYFLVENRQSSGFYDFSLPESGILFTHVDMDMPDGAGRFNDGPPANSYHGAWVERFLNIASADGAAWSADDSEDLFSPVTVPTTDANGDFGTGHVFYNIGYEGDAMGFDFRAGPTEVSGPIGENTTWYAYASPYVITGLVTVSDGDTLTIEPGVIVKFQSNTRMDINGTLIAAGTETDSIIFTSYNDDEYGGDTNGNGPSSGSPGYWDQLFFESADAGCVLDYCRIRYAGNEYYLDYYDRHYNAICLWDSGTALTMAHCIVESTYYTTTNYVKPGAIYARGGTSLDISHCVIRENQNDGIYAAGSLELRNSSIINNSNRGVYITSAGAVIVADTLSSNGAAGLNCPNLPAEFHDNISTDNGGWGFYIPAEVVDGVWNGGFASGNGRANAIGVTEGSIAASTAWIDDYHYAIHGNLTVPDAVTFTLEAGAVLKFNPDRRIHINGTLVAAGAEADSVVFTSYRDDSHGGDTNNDGPSSGSPGDWDHLLFDSADVGCNLAYSLIRFAGSEYYYDYYDRHYNAILLLGSGTGLTMTHSIVESTYYTSTNPNSSKSHAAFSRSTIRSTSLLAGRLFISFKT